MIKYQLLAVLWSLVLISESQVPQRPNLYDQDSVRNGEWILFYDSLGEEVTRQDSWVHYCLMDVNRGKPRGKVSCFYPTGVKSFSGYVIQLDPLVKHVRFTRYHENSALAEKGTYLYDSLNGSYEGYHPNGVLNGLALAFAEKGKAYYR